MKNLFIVIISVTIISCGITSKLPSDDINLLVGDWVSPCYSPLPIESGYKDCTLGSYEISIDKTYT